MMRPDKAELLKPLGRNFDIQEENVEGIKEFIRTVLYRGKENETYICTHVFSCTQNRKEMPLPPDPVSVIQVIKRAHHERNFVVDSLWSEGIFAITI